MASTVKRARISAQRSVRQRSGLGPIVSQMGLTPKRLDFNDDSGESSEPSSPPKRAKWASNRPSPVSPSTPTSRLRLSTGAARGRGGTKSGPRPKFPRLIEKGLKGMRLFDDPAHGPVTSPRTEPKGEALAPMPTVPRNRRRSEPNTAPYRGTPTGLMRRRLTLDQKCATSARRPVRKNRLANINPFTPDLARLLGLDDTPQAPPRLPNDGTFTPVTNPPRCSYEDLKQSIQHSLDKINQNTPSDPDLGSHFTSSPPSRGRKEDDYNPSRYDDEFVEIKLLGNGSFGQVKVVRHRLDGCIYVVKITGTRNEKAVMNEVFAHAALMRHKHIVRYYNSWMEKGRVYIQNEFCEGGSLDKIIRQRLAEGKKFSENELKRILLHVAKGLQYIHAKNLVHLDIKPENVFLSMDISSTGSSPKSNGDSSSSLKNNEAAVEMTGFEELMPAPEAVPSTSSRLEAPEVRKTPSRKSTSVQTTPKANNNHESTDSGNVSSGSETKNIEELLAERGVSYKIGDLGHVCAVGGDYMPEEGDCRYMAPELFANDIVRDNLYKADVFSLGLALYECASLQALPKNSSDCEGSLYSILRSGNPPTLEGYSAEFNSLIKCMLSPDVMSRPSASRLISNPIVKSVINKSRTNLDLYKELKNTRLKLKELEKTLANANLKKKILVGRGAKKSNSSYQ